MFTGFFSRGILSILGSALFVPLGIMVVSGLGYLYRSFETEINGTIEYIKTQYDTAMKWISDTYDETISYWKSAYDDSINYITSKYSDMVKQASRMYDFFVTNISDTYDNLKKSITDNFVDPIVKMFKNLFETIDYMKAKSTPEEFRGHLRLTALKYLSRYGKKDDELQELKKAKWYLDRLVQELENE